MIPIYYLYMIVYKITNIINNKVYIGLTTTSLEKRWRAHKNLAGKSDKHLYKSMNKYGVDNFNIEIIEETDSIEKLGELERHYIKTYNSTNPEYGYNITSGGEHNQLDANPKAKLSLDDVINIRLAYQDGLLTCKEVYQLYKDKIKFKPFERCYLGKSWTSVMPEVFNEINKSKHIQLRARKGQNNGNALYSDTEIMEMREFYKTHTFGETYDLYNKNQSKQSFNKVLKHEYTNVLLPEKKPYMRISKPRGPYKKKAK